MSQSQPVPYLDGEFDIIETEPTTLAELAEAGLSESDVIQDCVDNLRYRNKYPRVYKSVSKQIVESHSYPLRIVSETTKKDGTIKKVYESANDHLRGFLFGRKDDEGNITEPAVEGRREILEALLKETAQREPIYVKGERVGGGGKISQQALDNANKKFAAGPEAVEATVSTIEENVSGYKVGRDADDNVTVESLARGIMALGQHLKKKAEEQQKALLG